MGISSIFNIGNSYVDPASDLFCATCGFNCKTCVDYELSDFSFDKHCNNCSHMYPAENCKYRPKKVVKENIVVDKKEKPVKIKGHRKSKICNKHFCNQCVQGQEGFVNCPKKETCGKKTMCYFTPMKKEEEDKPLVTIKIDEKACDSNIGKMLKDLYETKQTLNDIIDSMAKELKSCSLDNISSADLLVALMSRKDISYKNMTFDNTEYIVYKIESGPPYKSPKEEAEEIESLQKEIDFFVSKYGGQYYETLYSIRYKSDQEEHDEHEWRYWQNRLHILTNK